MAEVADTLLKDRIPSLDGVTKDHVDDSTGPGTGDDETQGYTMGSLWKDISNGRIYICVDATGSSAVWNVCATF